MIEKMIRANLAQNRIVSVLMSGFLVVSAALLASAIYLIFGVFGTVDSFMEAARTPHFMQMHAGSLDANRMQAFVDGRTDVVAWEPIELLNVENSTLSFDGQSLETEIQQNGFVRQSKEMDLLLSLDREVVHPRPGEVWVPLFYEQKYDLQPGQTVVISQPDGDITFTIAGVFRDSQMNSTLASSKRLLISDADYDMLQQRLSIDPEYLISFRLTSPSDAASFEAAYANAGLESNGPSLTWSLFRLINSINDVITVVLFTLMSIIILLISLLCIRYTLLTAMEEDLHDIGVMKALGISNAHIRSIYLGKFRLLLGGGVLVGFVLSFLFREAVLGGVRRQMGTVNHEAIGIVAAAVGAALLYLVSMGYVRRVLQRLRSIAPLVALQGNSGLVTSNKRPRPLLRRSTGNSVNLRMAWANFSRSRGQHITVLVMAMLITIVLLVPFRFGATLGSPEFVTYLGMSRYDLRIDLINRDDAVEVADTIRATLEADDRISTFEIYAQEVEIAIDSNGVRTPLRIDYGNHDAYPVRYDSGRAPQTDTDLAISKLNAERLGVDVGDPLEVIAGESRHRFIISGIYQDITNGGKTAKALTGPTRDQQTPSMMIAISLKNDDDADAIIQKVTDAVDVPVMKTKTYTTQMMGDLIGVMKTMSWVFAIVASAIAALIAGLSIRLMQVQERRSNAIQAALGFTSRNLRFQYMFRIVGIMVIGALIGAMLAGPAGGFMGNLLFGIVGASGAKLVFSPLTTILGIAMVVVSALIVTLVNTRQSINSRIVDRLRG